MEKHGNTCRGYNATSVHLGNCHSIRDYVAHKRPERVWNGCPGHTHWERKETQNLSQTPSLERILRALRDETVVPWAPLGLIPKASTSQGSEGLDRAAQYLWSPDTSLKVSKPSLDGSQFQQVQLCKQLSHGSV